MIDEPFLIAYTDLAGLWPSLKPFLLPRLPIRGLQLLTLPGAPTKPARPLAARFIDSRDPLLSSDPQGRAFVFWSVQSFVHVILVTCEDLEDYKAKVKPRIEETLKVSQNITAYTLDLYNSKRIMISLGLAPKTHFLCVEI